MTWILFKINTVLQNKKKKNQKDQNQTKQDPAHRKLCEPDIPLSLVLPPSSSAFRTFGYFWEIWIFLRPVFFLTLLLFFFFWEGAFLFGGLIVFLCLGFFFLLGFCGSMAPIYSMILQYHWRWVCRPKCRSDKQLCNQNINMIKVKSDSQKPN